MNLKLPEAMIATDSTETHSQTYLDRFEELERIRGNSFPSWIAALRKSGIAHFAEQGFPTLDSEDWKYTNLAGLLKLPFQLAGRMASTSLEWLKNLPFQSIPSTQLVFVNGHFTPELSKRLPLPEGVRAGALSEIFKNDGASLEKYFGTIVRGNENAFSALNTAFLQDGAVVWVPKGVKVDQPIQLIFITVGSEVGVTAHPRVLLVAEENSAFTVVETHVGRGDFAYVSNGVIEIKIGAGANVEHLIFQDENLNSFHLGTIRTQLDRGANFISHSISAGARLSRNTIYSVLDGEGVEAVLNGLYLVDGEQLADHFMIVEHAKPHCNSHEYYNGILDGKGKGVFHGRILVRPGAIKTDAKQTNKNLLLCDDASIDTKPQLEIYADDVKCTHGATIGQLDEDSIFYLRSRGISAEEAKRMLIHAFAGEIVDRVRCVPLREELDQLIWDRLESHDQIHLSHHAR